MPTIERMDDGVIHRPFSMPECVDIYALHRYLYILFTVSADIPRDGHAFFNGHVCGKSSATVPNRTIPYLT